jgi:hypothetical protein
LALRATLAALGGTDERFQVLEQVLRTAGETPSITTRAHLILHGAHCLANISDETFTPCELRGRLAAILHGLLRLPASELPASLHVDLAGCVVENYVPVVNRCGTDLQYEPMDLFEAALEVFEARAIDAPDLAATYLRWFEFSDNLVVGVMVPKQTTRWNGILKRMRAVQSSLDGT